MEAPRELVFVVRIWIQPGEPSSDLSLRGSIQDVNAGTRFYVAGTRDIADFIDARLNAGRPPEGRPG